MAHTFFMGVTYTTCPECDGVGDKGWPPKTCKTCGGMGSVPVSSPPKDKQP